MKRTFALSVLAVTLGALCVKARSFEVGEKDFLLDGKPFVVRCGEVHYARIPRAYWRHRLQMLRAMGCNAVGCYMFWNFHEREKGAFTWDGRAEVPLYACNPPRVMQNGFIPELFQAANFGGDPEQRFEIVRKYQPKGPLMCAEYYPAWFDTWGQAHHPPKNDRAFFGPIDWMFAHGVSFSLYMAHGGTSFGGWSGCRNPFVPNVTSYDYEAPINENGRANPSFAKYRARAARCLNAGETIPEPPADIPTKAYGTVAMERIAPLDVLVRREVKMERPEFMERLGQGFGLVSYERMLAPGDGGRLNVDELHDFGYVFLDGKRIGTLDRRHRGVRPRIDRSKEKNPRRLQIVVEAMGRINSSSGMEDRKGMSGRVRLDKKELKGWTARMMPLDPDGGENVKCKMESVKWGSADVLANAPALYRGTINVPDDVPADTFLDMRDWTKGIVWVNGHNLGRFWSIGPQQTLYLPGCWLRKGGNEVVVLDFFGPRAKSEIASVGKAVLDVLQPETDFNRKERQNKKCLGGEEVASGTFPSGDEAQVVMFGKGVRGNFFTLQALTTYDAKEIREFSESNNHVPIIDANPRRGAPKPDGRGERAVGIAPAEKLRFRNRSGVERVNGHLHDAHGGRTVRVRGHAKVLLHLILGLLVIAVEQSTQML
ncbi:MAG: beta-galactosidase [Kiritimatiellae bacterium]|nr:beta-galactosidase [Kiritimatiellia bacterium]